jgi:DNA-binding HxlR family transcriptional regulator
VSLLTFGKLRRRVSGSEATNDPAVEQSRRDGPPPVCPDFHAAIELIGKRWTGAILIALTDGPLRFGELAKSVPGLSDRLLSQRLRELEDEGMVERTVAPEAPVKVTYALTAPGIDLKPAIGELRDWARRWKGRQHPTDRATPGQA